MYGAGTGLAQIKDAATTEAPATALGQGDVDHTGVPIGQLEPTYFYGNPAKRYLNVFSTGGCDIMVWRAQ
jgi:hypothetical protein